MSQNKQITLDNLTSALKAVYGQNTEVPLLIFRHWAARDYDMAQATPELIREIDESYLEKYHATPPLERSDALDFLNVYGEHFYKTASPKEHALRGSDSGARPLRDWSTWRGYPERDLSLIEWRSGMGHCRECPRKRRRLIAIRTRPKRKVLSFRVQGECDQFAPERARKPNDDAASRMRVLNRNATSVASAAAKRTPGAS